MAVSTVPQAQNRGLLVDGERKSYARLKEVLPLPNLIRVQIDSFKWFLEEGLRELFAEISPITDFTGRNLELQLLDYTIEIVG